MQLPKDEQCEDLDVSVSEERRKNSNVPIQYTDTEFDKLIKTQKGKELKFIKKADVKRPEDE